MALPTNGGRLKQPTRCLLDTVVYHWTRSSGLKAPLRSPFSRPRKCSVWAPKLARRRGPAGDQSFRHKVSESNSHAQGGKEHWPAPQQIQHRTSSEMEHQTWPHNIGRLQLGQPRPSILCPALERAHDSLVLETTSRATSHTHGRGWHLKACHPLTSRPEAKTPGIGVC